MVLSIFPLTAPTMVTERLGISDVPVWQIAASMIKLGCIDRRGAVVQQRRFQDVPVDVREETPSGRDRVELPTSIDATLAIKVSGIERFRYVLAPVDARRAVPGDNAVDPCDITLVFSTPTY